MSLVDGFSGRDPFTADPFLRVLDDELDVVARGVHVTEGEVALGRFEISKVLQDIDTVPPNAFLTLDVQTDESVLDTVRFFRGDPKEYPLTNWFWLPNDLRDGGQPVPVAMGGSRVGESLFGDTGQIREGYSFTFTELAMFRSGADMARGSYGGGTELPAPERLDQHLFAMLLGQGVIALDRNNYYCWRLPTDVHETGTVIDARVLTAPED